MPRPQTTEQIAAALLAAGVAVTAVKPSVSPEVEDDEITLAANHHVQVDTTGAGELILNRWTDAETLETLFVTTRVDALVREIRARHPALLG